MFLDHHTLAADCGSDDPGWFVDNIPFLACPDEHIQRTWYFRWGVFRKHLKQTPDGWVITEFLPEVPWSDKHNAITCAAGHHLYEARWLRAPVYAESYARFWFRSGANPLRYGFWAADAIHAIGLARGHLDLGIELLGDLVRKFEDTGNGWEEPCKWALGEGRRDRTGLYWQPDTGDGMEFSISGGGLRPEFNSYMYGDAMAIARIARAAGEGPLAERFLDEARHLRRLVHGLLWDSEAQFFKTLVNERAAAGFYDWQEHAPRIWQAGEMPDVREQVGYVPWYFHLPEPGHEAAWAQLRDPQGFAAPWGLTTAEQRHQHFMYQHSHDCLWNGPVWPYATTQTLVALANLLNDYRQDVVDQADYLAVLGQYARSHVLFHPDHGSEPWIDENMHPYSGAWLARGILQARHGPDYERGKDYNHSGYADPVVTGLVGLRPRLDDRLQVNPLIPADEWDWFCLENIPYHGHDLTIAWDRHGNRYGKRGLCLYADGALLHQQDQLGPAQVPLPTP